MVHGSEDHLTEGLEVQAINPWAALSFRDYRFLWGANIFSQIGQHMRQLVNYYLIYEITGSTLQLGLTGLFQLIPMLSLGLFGGTLADLFDRKKLILATLSMGLSIPVLAWTLTSSGSIQVWHIFAFVMATSLVNVFGGPSRMAMLARTVPRTHLANAVTFNWGTAQVTMLAGPIIAGLVIAWAGPANGYLVSAILYIPAIIGISMLRNTGEDNIKDKAGRKVNVIGFVRIVLSTTWEGAKFIFSQRLLMSMFGLDIGVTLVTFFRPLLAAFAKDVYHVGPSSLGTITAAVPFGSLIGAIVMLFASKFERKGLMILGSTFLYAIILGLFGLTPVFWVAVVLVGALGFFDAIAVTIKHATVQVVTPDGLRGRASSAIGIAGMTANATGTLQVGLVAAYIGPQGAVLLGSAIAIGVVAVGWIILTTLREYRT